MARERDYDEDLRRAERVSPYQQDDEQTVDYDDDLNSDPQDDDLYVDTVDPSDRYTDNREAYREEYDEEEYDDEAYEDGEAVGFFSTIAGKVVAGIIALLIVVLVALLVVRFMGGPKDSQSGSQIAQLPTTAEETKAPGSIIFAPILQPTQQPTAEPTVEPTEQPKPTGTPLPIIMSNTPTPSPTPTVTPTPSPTPTPVPTATPEPTAVPEIGTGEVNRDAKLRESASSSGSVKSTIKKGERVTIHDTVLDKDSKVWYALTVDDLATTGWMRDYVVDSDQKIAKPTHTPKPTATPDPNAEEEPDSEDKTEEPEVTPEPTKAPAEDVIGTGRTEKEANVRKIMNGKVIVQLRKNKKVEILSVKTDKNGKLWYEIRPEGSSTVGFVRDYLIDLDEGVKLTIPTATPKPEESPKPEEEEAVKIEAEQDEPKEKEESVLDREIIGKAKTKKPANIRVKPASGAKLVRQLSKGIALMVLDKYQDQQGNIWYEVCTESGRTQGFARDYLLDFSEIDKEREAKTYGEE